MRVAEKPPETGEEHQSYAPGGCPVRFRETYWPKLHQADVKVGGSQAADTIKEIPQNSG